MNGECGHSPTPSFKNDMNLGSNGNNRDGTSNLPEWADCDLFCIQDYAGAVNSPCGWRGRFHQAARDATGAQLVCPRCGCATLFRIPFDRADSQ